MLTPTSSAATCVPLSPLACVSGPATGEGVKRQKQAEQAPANATHPSQASGVGDQLLQHVGVLRAHGLN